MELVTSMVGLRGVEVSFTIHSIIQNDYKKHDTYATNVIAYYYWSIFVMTR